MTHEELDYVVSTYKKAPMNNFISTYGGIVAKIATIPNIEAGKNYAFKIVFNNSIDVFQADLSFSLSDAGFPSEYIDSSSVSFNFSLVYNALTKELDIIFTPTNTVKIDFDIIPYDRSIRVLYNTPILNINIAN